MDGRADNMRRAGTGRSGLMLVGMVAVIILVLIGAAWVLTLPGVLENVLLALVVVIVAIVVIIALICVAYVLIAIPMYVHKGEQYQEGVDYSLSGIEPVEGKDDPDDRS